MTTFPALNAIRNAASSGAQKTNVENMLAALKELPGARDASILEISSGVVTPTGFSHRILGENQAFEDDLNRIAVDNHPEGRLLLIRNATTLSNVTVKHNSGGIGEILLRSGQDFRLDFDEINLLLIRRGNAWEEVMKWPLKGRVLEHESEVENFHRSNDGFFPIPFDDTIPLWSEGTTTFVTLFYSNIKSQDNHFLFTANLSCSHQVVGGSEITVTIVDGTNTVIAAASKWAEQNQITTISLRAVVSPANREFGLYFAHAGSATQAQFDVNGLNDARKLGGIMNSVAAVLEIEK